MICHDMNSSQVHFVASDHFNNWENKVYKNWHLISFSTSWRNDNESFYNFNIMAEDIKWKLFPLLGVKKKLFLV